MIICKNLDINEPIRTTKEWFEKCPPQGKEKHWVDGRSAKETAKYWINGAPKEFLIITKPLGVCCEIVSPEYVSYFDDYNGNGRNHDLIIFDIANKILLTIESKVDESFGNLDLQKYLEQAENKKLKGENTNADKRLEELKIALFKNPNSKKLNPLMYQLIVGIAGTLAEAKKLHCKKAVFIVQTFLTDDMNSEKHRNNQMALDYFLELVSDGKYKIIHDGDLLNIGTVPGSINISSKHSIPNDVDLYIGKYSIRI